MLKQKPKIFAEEHNSLKVSNRMWYFRRGLQGALGEEKPIYPPLWWAGAQVLSKVMLAELNAGERRAMETLPGLVWPPGTLSCLLLQGLWSGRKRPVW